jgi:tetratricopeptide (TPR) repeat protein
MLRLAESVAKRWSTGREADEARMVLLEAALDDGRLDQARGYLDAIPLDSPRRGEVELGLGQALWTAYRRAVRLPAAGQPGKEQLQDMVAQARQLLKAGMERMREPLEAGGPISGMLAAASLAMAEISLDAGHFSKAVQRLEDPKVGARTLVDVRDRAAQWGDFPAETYRVALRVYVAAGQEEEAQRAMLELENVVRQQSAADAARRLTQTAVQLGRDLDEQIDEFRRQGRGELVAPWVRAMDTFLVRVAAARDQTSFYRLHAVAEGFYGLGAGLDLTSAAERAAGSGDSRRTSSPVTGPSSPVTGPSSLPTPALPGARDYYRRAAEAFRDLLRRCDHQKGFAPQAESVTAVRVRLASCLRRLGEYPAALELLRAVLKEHATMVDAQVEAAYTYQDWGLKQPDRFRLAIEGDPGSREIWGWKELARQVEAAARYREVFFTARYNLALCRFRRAQAEPRAEDRTGLLLAAKEDLRGLQRLHPDLGGRAPTTTTFRVVPGSWQDRFDELLRRIEDTLKESK